MPPTSVRESPRRKIGPHPLLRNSIIRILSIALIFSTLSLTSCGTMMRGGYCSECASPGMYRGVRNNFSFLFSATSAQFCWPLIVCPLAFIVTAPVDIVIDTVMIPADLSR